MSTTRSDAILRHAAPADAAAFVELFERVAASSPYMNFGPGERGVTPEQQAALIEQWEARRTAVLTLAWVDDVAVGFASVARSPGSRSLAAAVVMGVDPDRRRQGLGRALLRRAEQSAMAIGAARLELTVVAANAAAIALYRRGGFAIEGTRRASMVLDGRVVDELYMAKLLSPTGPGVAS